MTKRKIKGTKAVAMLLIMATLFSLTAFLFPQSASAAVLTSRGADGVEYPLYHYNPSEIAVQRGDKIVEVAFENKLKTAQVELQKLSNHPDDMIAQGLYNKPLAGAQYGIYRADTDELITTMTTAGVMGRATSEVFQYAGDGEFYIMEITPPKYYAHDPNKYYFSMTKDHELLVREVKNDTLIGKMTVWYKEVETDEEAPKTGDDSSALLYLLMFGCCAVMLAVLLFVKKRSDKSGAQERTEGDAFGAHAENTITKEDKYTDE